MQPGQIDVWRIELTAPDDMLSHYRQILDDHERKRATAFLDDHDRQQYIVAHGQMRIILALYLGISPLDVKIIQPRGEKPFIEKKPILFNLSHTAGYGLLAVSNTGEVGIDIEYKRDNVRIDLISRSTFSDQERQALLFVPEVEERRTRFFNCWTRKEAFIKAIGKGFSYDTKSFSVPVASETTSRILSFDKGDYDPQQWRLLSFVPAPNTQAALAFAFILTRINFFEITKMAAPQCTSLKM